MKIDKQTLMLFGGGLVAGYLICKFMSKSNETMSQPVEQEDAPVEFSADGRPRVSRRRTNPFFTSMGATPPIGSTGNLNPKVSRRRN